MTLHVESSFTGCEACEVESEKCGNSVLEGTGKVVALPGDETVLPLGYASFRSGSTSLPQPAFGEPLSPVHVLEV